MGDYKLSAILSGHEDDVKCVVFPEPSFALSSSRDATVRLWTLKFTSPPALEDEIKHHGDAFINSVAFVRPTEQFAKGLIVSGDQHSLIDVRPPDRLSDDGPEATLLGHGNNVCALAISDDNKYILSGSWDAGARLWPVGRWGEHKALEGHSAAVWAVMFYDANTLITGCADKGIRLFRTDGSPIKTIQADDVVRALCRLGPNHPSGAHFASAGNDATITLWTINGRRVRQLHGHDSFIYSLATLPNGLIVSSGEDRTARIWDHQRCLQTITHPAISVWSVAVCSANSDIITGASDRLVRIFSASPERQASTAAIEAFNDSVKQFSIPQQAAGNINKEQLPGPEFLTTKSGTKDGQVQMVKELDGKISAYQWSSASNEWINIGTVVDQVGSSGRKITYNGKDYDYVFDVDIEEGKPPLKLPYNLSQNAFEVARKFCEDHKLPITYVDQVFNFIVQNTQGATIGQSTAAAPAAPPPETKPRTILPQNSYLDILTANHAKIMEKVEEYNKKIIEEGHKELSLNPTEAHSLSKAVNAIKNRSDEIDPDGVNSIVKIATTWPADKRLPGLDLLRLVLAFSGPAKQLSEPDQRITQLLIDSGSFDTTSPENSSMLAIRAFSNLFRTEAGRRLMNAEFDNVRKHLERFCTSRNRNLIIALATLYINYAVDLIKKRDPEPDRAVAMLADLTQMIDHAKDSEALYRALVATGTILTLDNDYCDTAQEAFNLGEKVHIAKTRMPEKRIQEVVAEIAQMLS